jgi:hypothetical protein
MRTSKLPLLLALPFASLAACNWNEVEQGRLGKVEMTPSNCGQPGCDLDDGIAVGGALDLEVRGKGGLDVSDLRLVSSAPWIVDVVTTDDFGTPSFSLRGNAPGLADLIAIDRWGYEVDYLPVEVAAIADFEVSAVADGMIESSLPGLGRVFEVNADTDVRLDVAGTSRGRALTGEVQLLVTLDAALAVAMLPGSDPARGELHFRAPAGAHDVAIVAPGGAHTVVRVIGKPLLTTTR